MASEIRANKQTNRVGLGTVTYTDTGIIVSGIVTANSFKGDGSLLTGIDATALKDTAGNVKIQANTSGAIHSGVSTFNSDLKIGNAVTFHDNGGQFQLKTSYFNVKSKVGEDMIIAYNNEYVRLFHDGNQKFTTTSTGAIVTGVMTATSFSGDGSNLTGVGGVAVQSAAPSSANVGDLWYDTDDGRIFVYYNDGNSAQWVDASPNGTPTDLVIEGDLTPATDNSSDLGASNKRWANVYSADLQLSNVGTGGNEVDRSEGSWTIQEGEEDLFLINRRNGKKYKFNLTEVS